MSVASVWAWGELDHTRAAALLAKYVPGAAGVGLEPFGCGDHCLAFKVRDRVVRVARHARAADAMRRAACVLPRIAHALPLRVPRPTYYSPVDCPPFTIHEEVVGDVLTRNAWLAMPSAALAEAAADLAQFLAALHALPAAIGMECGLPQLNGVALARRLRETAARTVGQLLEPETARRFDAVLRRWSVLPALEPTRRALIHCDIGPGHLLHDPSSRRLTGVIDFDDLAIGDPARDFIFIYEDYGPRILEAVLNHYARENARVSLDDVRKWYVLEAAAWTCEMHVARRTTDRDHGLAEITREFADPSAD